MYKESSARWSKPLRMFLPNPGLRKQLTCRIRFLEDTCDPVHKNLHLDPNLLFSRLLIEIFGPTKSDLHPARSALQMELCKVKAVARECRVVRKDYQVRWDAAVQNLYLIDNNTVRM